MSRSIKRFCVPIPIHVFHLRGVQDPEAFERDYLNLIARDSSSTAQTPAVRSVTGGVNEPVDEYTTVGRGGKVMQFTSEGIFKHLQAVQEARGKKVCSQPSCPSHYF